MNELIRRAALPAVPHVRIEPGAVIGDGVVFAEAGRAETVVRAGARIEADSAIGGGVEIGPGARVRPGSVVTTSVPANAVVEGDPAEVLGFVDARRVAPPPEAEAPAVLPLGDGGAAVHRMRRVREARGDLIFGETLRDLPFAPRRWFVVTGVPAREARGAHAHWRSHQFLVCVHGSCRALVDDGRSRWEATLDAPDVGVYMPPLTWGTQYRFSPDAALLVLASDAYDPDDYIRDYESLSAARRDRS